jgi:hypothetical protein
VVVLESADTVGNAMRVKYVVVARFVNIGVDGIIVRTVEVPEFVNTVDIGTDVRIAGES